MIKLLRFLLKHSRGPSLLAVLTGIAGGIGGVGMLALIPAALRPGADTRTLAFVFAGVCLATIAARVAMQVAMVRISQGSVSRLIGNLCEQILSLSLPEFEALDLGALTAVLTEDVVVLTAALSGLPLLMINLTVFAGCFAYLAILSRAVLISTLIFAVPAILTHQWLTRQGRGLMIRARAEHDALAGHIRAILDGFRELKLHGERRAAFLDESIRESSDRLRARNVAAMSLFAGVSGWGQLLYFGFIGFLVFGLPALVDLPREVLAAAVLTVVYANSPLDGVLHWLPIVARAGASMGRIEALGLSLDALGIPEGAEPAESLGTLVKPLVLQGVTHTYPGERDGEGFMLGPIDLTVRPGELLFLVGGNGSGKTTLVKLLTGLYPPGSGTIRYNGRAIDRASAEAYRQSFTAVFADGFLFPTLLGLPATGLDARASELLSDLGLDRVVRVEGGAFSTTSLSQGQKKRLALLVACLEDRPILVLDEWASYQDPTFKRAFYLEILPALKAAGKTLVVISHDEDYFFVADRVVHLSAGMVASDPAPTLPPLPVDSSTESPAHYPTRTAS